MPTLPRTGERLLPDKIDTIEDYLLYLRHQATFHFIKNLIQSNENCLEVGCGAGFGSYILSSKAKNVLGTDIDGTAIGYAIGNYKKKNLRFRKTDATNMASRDSEFDTTVASHVLEHVKQVPELITELKRVTKRDGRIIIVTPNRLYRLATAEKPWNIFHMREFSPNGLRNELLKHFNDVEILGIRGNEEINKVEYGRIKKIRGIVKLDLLGVRYWIPGRLKNIIKGFLIGISNGKKFRSGKFNFKDFIIDDKLERSLDLIAVCENTKDGIVKQTNKDKSHKLLEFPFFKKQPPKTEWEKWTGLKEYTENYPITKKRKKLFLNFIKRLPPGLKILDVGCYVGDVTNQISKLGHDAYGIDISIENIKQAKVKHPNLTFKKSELNDSIPFPDNFFDVIWAGDIIEHVYDTIKLFSEFNRTLKKGGYLVCSTPYHGRLKMLAVSLVDLHRHFHPEHQHVRFYTDKNLRRILNKYGFTVKNEYYLGRVWLISNNMLFISKKAKELDWDRIPKTFR